MLRKVGADSDFTRRAGGAAAAAAHHLSSPAFQSSVSTLHHSLLVPLLSRPSRLPPQVLCSNGDVVVAHASAPFAELPVQCHLSHSQARCEQTLTLHSLRRAVRNLSQQPTVSGGKGIAPRGGNGACPRRPGRLGLRAFSAAVRKMGGLSILLLRVVGLAPSPAVHALIRAANLLSAAAWYVTTMMGARRGGGGGSGSSGAARIGEGRGEDEE